ncbi:MAG: DUF3500 domain-containing protein [Candidatus Latescibacteria bacterium]|jgi:hypothetical protein|nr:DUF3500 domain-containing protein [Candidatus Latescibacterota bacterium]
MAAHESDILSGPSIRVLVERMGEAADRFLSSLAPDQKAKATGSFGDGERRTFWHYTPIPREGLPLEEMEFEQRRLAHQLVATGVSRSGYVAVSSIIGLETTLDMYEGWKKGSWIRNPGNYYVSIFGTPGTPEPWGWKFEGHHVSLNYTIVDGQIVSPTPTFFGANPADAALNGVGALRPIGNVEDIARDLIHSLSDEQRHDAVLASVAPPDMVTMNAVRVEEVLQAQDQLEVMNPEVYESVRYTKSPKGLDAALMAPPQREILNALVNEYINRMPDVIAQIESDRLGHTGLDGIYLAWAGGIEKREGHYYRLQSDRFLVEYDNTQNDANHIHSVWRNPGNDFGADLIAQHYHETH